MVAGGGQNSNNNAKDKMIKCVLEHSEKHQNIRIKILASKYSKYCGINIDT